MSFFRNLGLLLVFSGLNACAFYPRVALPTLPARTAPREEREKAYRALEPVRVKGSETTVFRRGVAIASLDRTHGVQLRSGMWVIDAHDLLPAVPNDSATARAIAESDASSSKSLGFRAAFLASALGTGAMFFHGNVTNYEGYPFPQDWGRDAKTISLGAVFASTYILSLVADHYSNVAEGKRAEAFQAYGGDLKKQLGLDEPEAAPQAAPVATAP